MSRSRQATAGDHEHRHHAEIQAREERLARFEEYRAHGVAERQIGEGPRQDHLGQAPRVHGPEEVGARRHGLPCGPTEDVEGGHPLRGGEAEREQYRHGEKAGHGPQGRGVPTAPPRLGDQAQGGRGGGQDGHVPGAGEDLPRRQEGEDDGPSEARRLEQPLQAEQHPGHPCRAHEMVGHADRRHERAAGHPRRAGHHRGQARQPEDPRKQERADGGAPRVAEYQDLVDRGRQEQEVEPGGRVVHLVRGIGEQRQPESLERVPEGQRTLRHHADQRLHLGLPVGVEVALEEDTTGECRCEQDGGDQGEGEDRRAMGAAVGHGGSHAGTGVWTRRGIRTCTSVP
jgi:hypothetical protein